MTVANAQKIFSVCNNIMSHSFNILGFHITLYQVILFDILVTLIVGSILKLFNKD